MQCEGEGYVVVCCAIDNMKRNGLIVFFFNDTATTEIYTLSLHDALPILVMLSGETSVGKYPVGAVKMMNDILLTTESQTQFKPIINYDMPSSIADNLFDATGRGFTDIANQINTAAIVIFTHFGRKAKVMSKFRPRAPIFAVSNKFETLNVLNLYRGIVPFYLENFEDEEASILEMTNFLKEKEYVKKGEVILFTSGAPITDKGRRNWIRFSIV